MIFFQMKTPGEDLTGAFTVNHNRYRITSLRVAVPVSVVTCTR